MGRFPVQILLLFVICFFAILLLRRALLGAFYNYIHTIKGVGPTAAHGVTGVQRYSGILRAQCTCTCWTGCCSNYYVFLDPAGLVFVDVVDVIVVMVVVVVVVLCLNALVFGKC